MPPDDNMKEHIVGAGLIALGAIMGFVLGRIDSWLERRRRKKALAKALLVELRAAENALRQYVSMPGMPVYDILQLPVLRGNVSDLSLLSSNTAERLVHFLLLTDGLKGTIEGFRNVSTVGGGAKRRDYFMQATAAYCIRQLPELAQSLYDEGADRGFAVLPEPTVGDNTLPDMPERVFAPLAHGADGLPFDGGSTGEAHSQ